MAKKIKNLGLFATKKCYNHCPQCGANFNDRSQESKYIELGHIEFDIQTCQNFICLYCGCEFQEVYEYSTSIKTGQRKEE